MNNEEIAESCYNGTHNNNAEELAQINEDDGYDQYLNMLVWLIEFNRNESASNWTNKQKQTKFKKILDAVDVIIRED